MSMGLGVGGIGIGKGGARRRQGAIARIFATGVSGFWHDAADTSTLWADAAGTVPATVGGVVRRIDDKSGNGFHRVAPSDAKSAKLKRDELGLLYLEGNGKAYYNIEQAILYSAAGAATLVAAVAGAAISTSTIYSELHPGSGQAYARIGVRDTTTDHELLVSASSTSSAYLADAPVYDGVRRVVSFRDAAKTISGRADDRVTGTATYTTLSVPTRSTLMGYDLSTPRCLSGRFYAAAGFAATLSDADYDAVHAEMDARVSKAANPVWPVLSRWLSGGISGKTITLSGDSTTAVATSLLASLARDQGAGEYLEGTTIINGATGGQSCEGFIAETGVKGLEALAANGSDLYTLCWGINDVRLGATTEAQLRARLVTCVERIKTVNPGADIILIGPNELLSIAGGGVEPPESGQAYTDILYNTYESLRGEWSDVPVIQKQDIFYRTSATALADDVYMMDGIHPGPTGQVLSAGMIVDAIRGPQ